jgi:hypothetical protein
LEAGCEELDWFLENDKAQICKSTDIVPPDEIPPYAWLNKTLVDIGARDIATMDRTREDCMKRMGAGGTIDEVFEVLRCTWALLRKIDGTIARRHRHPPEEYRQASRSPKSAGGRDAA